MNPIVVAYKAIGDAIRDLDHSFAVLGATAGIAAIVLAVALRRGRDQAAPSTGQPRLSVLIGGGAAALLLLSLALPLPYVRVAGYLNHVEPQIAIGAWRACLGDSVYPDPTAAGQISLPYGALLYRVHCLAFLPLGPSIAASKLPGILAFEAAILLMFLAARASCTPPRPLLPPLLPPVLIAAWAAVVLPITAPPWAYNAAFWARAEPFGVLLAALGALSLRMRHPALRSMTLGLLAGLSMGFKPHWGLAFVPLLALGVELRLSRDLLVQAALAGVFAAAAFLAGFCGGDLGGYLLRLRLSAHAPHEPELLFLGLCAGVMLSGPLLFGVGMAERAVRRRYRLAVLAYGLCLAATVAISTKSGAGPHHLMPFAPVSIAFLCAMSRAGRGAATGSRVAMDSRMAWPLGAMILLMLPLFMHYGLRLLDRYNETERLRPAVAAMERIAASLQGRMVHFGVTDMRAYPAMWLRPIVAFRAGGAYLTDPAAVMDFHRIGIPPSEDLIRRIAACDGAAWVLPQQGEPLSARADAPPGGRIYHDRYVAALLDNYEPTTIVAPYQVWTCKRR